MADRSRDGLRPLPPAATREEPESETTELFYQTPSGADPTDEAPLGPTGDTTEIRRQPKARKPIEGAPTQVLPRSPSAAPAGDLPTESRPIAPSHPPQSLPPTRPARPAPSRIVPLLGLLLATLVGAVLFAVLVLIAIAGNG